MYQGAVATSSTLLEGDCCKSQIIAATVMAPRLGPDGAPSSRSEHSSHRAKGIQHANRESGKQAIKTGTPSHAKAGLECYFQRRYLQFDHR